VDLNNREKRLKRRTWRQQQQNCHGKMKAATKLSPPPTPSESRQIRQTKKQRRQTIANSWDELKKIKDDLHRSHQQDQEFKMDKI